MYIRINEATSEHKLIEGEINKTLAKMSAQEGKEPLALTFFPPESLLVNGNRFVIRMGFVVTFSGKLRKHEKK